MVEYWQSASPSMWPRCDADSPADAPELEVFQ